MARNCPSFLVMGSLPSQLNSCGEWRELNGEIESSAEGSLVLQVLERKVAGQRLRPCGRLMNLSTARRFAFTASSSRFLESAVVSSEQRRRMETSVISLTASKNETSFA